MATATEVADFGSLVALINSDPILSSLLPSAVAADQIHVTDYGYDARIKWHTYLVTIDGLGVWGMTNSPLTEESGQ